MSPIQHATEEIRDAVRTAAESAVRCVPVGANSKGVLADVSLHERIELRRVAGVIDYAPSEFVVTAAAGTKICELEQLLAGEGQVLGFEAPFCEQATLGGAVACGLAGPARPFHGAVRDFVLGAELVNGRGELLAFGGKVIKNVAGYDVSRLCAGSWGTLGVIVSLSLRVLPRPEQEVTLALHCAIQEAIAQMVEFARGTFPVTGCAFVDGQLFVRLSGVESRVIAAQQRIGGEQLEKAQEFWKSLADQRHAFFLHDAPILRISVPPATPHVLDEGEWLIDWGGALRWLAGNRPSAKLRSRILAEGGVLLPWPPSIESWLQTGDAGIDRLQQRIREAFDPHGVFARWM